MTTRLTWNTILSSENKANRKLFIYQETLLIYIYMHLIYIINANLFDHDDVMKWKHFPRYWTFARGIHRSPADSPHEGQSRGAMMFSLKYAWANGWTNNQNAGDLRRHGTHCDVTVMAVASMDFWYSFKHHLPGCVSGIEAISLMIFPVSKWKIIRVEYGTIWQIPSHSKTLTWINSNLNLDK